MNDELATFLRAVARASEDLADALQTGPSVPAEPDEIRDADLPTGRGPRQAEMISVLLTTTNDGMKTADIARAIDMDQANAYLTLQALQKQEIAEMVPGVQPQRWRLVDRYRARQQIVRIAGLVGKGEVTTYGDISRVVYGHFSGGLAVGRVAATGEDFPTPHRVLESGGLIPVEWRTTDGTLGIEECIRLLREDGLEVQQAGDRFYVTPPTVIVGWDELARRLREVA